MPEQAARDDFPKGYEFRLLSSTNLWNELPLELKQANNTNAFKNQIDKIPKFKLDLDLLFKEFH